MTTYLNVHEDLDTIARAADGMPTNVGNTAETIGALAREIQRLRAEIVDINDEIGSVPPDGLTS